jgi:predicted ATPase
MLKSLKLKNILSFGPDSEPVELGPLNVLIGPNGSGKSNLIEAIDLLRSTPSDLLKPIREGGGVASWLWKGKRQPEAEVEAVIAYSEDHSPLRHRISFTEVDQQFQLIDERIESATKESGKDTPFLYFGYEDGGPVLNPTGSTGPWLMLRPRLNPQQSIIAQRRDPERFPEISSLGDYYRTARLYKDWSFGHRSPLRSPQAVDLPNHFLEENGQNLGLVLNRLRLDYPTKQAILERLGEVYAGVQDFEIRIDQGTVQVMLQENNWALPASRLSDGTIRWLTLLAILLHPEPPPLVVIEEPELGLHPDVMPALATLLKEASARAQLIVTTHSDGLIDALTDSPECVLVCEKPSVSTMVRRLDGEQLSEWLKEYSLGQLWRKGEIGGNRW